jgi:hypothetical protein
VTQDPAPTEEQIQLLQWVLDQLKKSVEEDT